MDRAEKAGLGIAVIGHVALFAALSLGLMAAPDLPVIHNDPVEVELVDDAALQSSAPQPDAAPASAPAPAAEVQELSPPTPLPPPLPPVAKAAPVPAPKPVATPAIQPKPAPKSAPKAPPKPAPKPQPAPAKPAPAKAKPAPARTASEDTRPRRRPGLSRSIVAGLSDAPSAATTKTNTPGKAVTPAKPAATGMSAAQMTGPQKAALNGLIYRQLKPFWKPPSGADAELLVTRLSVRLNRDGTLAEDPEIVGQDGITDSNRAQAKLHAERAIQAVRRAAPFNLPPDYYDAWKWLKPLKLYVGQPG